MTEMTPLKPSLRQTILATAARYVDAFLGSRGCFFTFHRAAPEKVWETLPNRDFYLDLDFLDSLLTYLKVSGRDVVTIAEGRRRSAEGKRGRPYVNFSVDDCYRDTYEQVAPLFRSHGVPVTLFVTTGIPDGTMTMWGAGLEDTIFNRTEIMVDGHRILTDTIERKMNAYALLEARWDGPKVAEFYERFCAENGLDALALHWKHAITWEMLEELARDPLVEIGSHTVSHPRVSAIGPEEAMRELSDSRRRLQEKLKVPVNDFAFPYGRLKDCSPRDFEIARLAGYDAVSTTTKGLVRHGGSSFVLPRITLNGGHRNLLVPELHMAGATALAAKVIGRV